MPVDHILVSTQIRCEIGPTIVGDSESDPVIMEQVEAQLIYRLGNTFAEWQTEWAPRRVLNKLSELGYAVIGFCGLGQTCIWTMAKEVAAQKIDSDNGTDYYKLT